MKAIALLSGGLDSTLAVRVILDQGIEVEALNFFSPFCLCNRKKSGCGYESKKVADRFGVKLKIFNIFEEYIEIVKKPKFGYGKNINPCIDCRILMHKKAREYMRQAGAAFIITGEVLGQRPMSQHKAALKIIERESGLEGLVLRPLSAKLLPLTVPEKKGWVNRERLLEISGRSRKPQMARAKEYKIEDYPCPAGGCLLTDSVFARKMRDLMKHSELSLEEIQLLKVGRHFRLSEQTKVVVGRNEEENEKLLQLTKKGDVCFQPHRIPGPVGIARGNLDQTLTRLVAQIVARYSDSLQAENVEIAVKDSTQNKIDCIKVDCITENQLEKLRI
ncbi:MAG: hypothetical protein NG712_02395 [Omnitrophica bacterium]|nr:hypothetical protein [Candidatus Omnitrophota bacterium]